MLNAARFLAAVVGAVLGLVAAGIFFLSNPNEHYVLKAAVFGVPSVTLIGWMIWSFFRPGKVPDFILRVSRGSLDGNGVSFVISPVALPDRLGFEILFQNRYEGECSFTVVLSPGIDRMSTRKVTVDPCPGGALGRARIEFHLLEEYAHKRVSFSFGASAEYPQGAGAALLFRQGTPVSPAEHVEMGMLGLVFGLPAGLKLEMPAPQLPAPATLTSTWEILWKPGDPLPGTDMNVSSGNAPVAPPPAE